VQRLVSAPWQVEDTRRLALDSQSKIDEMRAELEAAARAQIEALAFLTRSVNELNRRLGELERSGGQSGP
jgi:hypothetical protein